MTLEFSRVALPPLWTVDEAKAKQLKLRDALHDDDIQEKLDRAQDAILAYLTTATDPAWTAATAPAAVKGAILILTTHYYENRGDGLDQNPDADRKVWEEIANLLGRHRDPTLA